MKDPDPGGPKTYGSGTLFKSYTLIVDVECKHFWKLYLNPGLQDLTMVTSSCTTLPTPPCWPHSPGTPAGFSPLHSGALIRFSSVNRYFKCVILCKGWKFRLRHWHKKWTQTKIIAKYSSLPVNGIQNDFHSYLISYIFLWKSSCNNCIWMLVRTWWGSDNNTSWNYCYIKMIYLLFSPDNEHFVSSSSDHSVKAGWAMASFLRCFLCRIGFIFSLVIQQNKWKLDSGRRSFCHLICRKNICFRRICLCT
jgi:hypothetical protein